MRSELRWPILGRFRSYVEGLPDGVTEADVGSDGEDFLFPPEPGRPETANTLRFRGSVRFSGHGGLLRVDISRPAVFVSNGDGALTIEDPWEVGSGARMLFAEGAATNEMLGRSRIITLRDLRLTDEACDLFNGAYSPGAPVGRAIATMGA